MWNKITVDIHLLWLPQFISFCKMAITFSSRMGDISDYQKIVAAREAERSHRSRTHVDIFYISVDLGMTA